MLWHQGWFANWHASWFGIKADASAPGAGPEGVATFSLDLDNGYRVTYRWHSDIIKHRSGTEQRISRNDHPKEMYRGSVLLFGEAPATLRAQMARHAAQGQAFILGLPHEELTLRLPSSGTTVYVHDTTDSDWMNPGQRVIVRHRDHGSIDAVIQSTTSTTIVLDVNPGAAGSMGGSIMPSMPIYLEAEQAFPRYATDAERWEIDARAAVFGFATTRATLQLGPITASAAFDNAFIECRLDGAIGNQVDFALVNVPALAGLLLADANYQTSFAFNPGVTTIGQLATALESSAYVRLAGTYNAASTIAAGDAFGFTSLTGAATSGSQGTGATLATYASRPLWDRDLENDDTITDSIQAMTEVLDFGGLPYAIGSADFADWGRKVRYSAPLGEDWQWFKLFMSTVKGRQKAFWLPTWRDDLPFVSKAAGTITVEADVAAWWPAQRQHVQIVETSGTKTRAQITAATNNGNGTWTLTIGTTLASSSVAMVSWLELCRWTSDDCVVTFIDGRFEVEMTATVVQQ